MNHLILATLGGGLVGIAAIMMMGLKGRIAGASGIAAGLLSNTPDDRLWRILFVLGIVIGGAIPVAISTDFVPPRPEAGTVLIVISALLVGIGTRIGSGCTSGHGICGVARLSPRSLAATATFMAAGFTSVYLLRHVFGA